MSHQDHTYHETMTGCSKQNRKVEMARGVRGGGGGGMRKGEMEMGINEWPCWLWNMDHHISLLFFIQGKEFVIYL